MSDDIGREYSPGRPIELGPLNSEEIRTNFRILERFNELRVVPIENDYPSVRVNEGTAVIGDRLIDVDEQVLVYDDTDYSLPDPSVCQKRVDIVAINHAGNAEILPGPPDGSTPALPKGVFVCGLIHVEDTMDQIRDENVTDTRMFNVAGTNIWWESGPTYQYESVDYSGNNPMDLPGDMTYQPGTGNLRVIVDRVNQVPGEDYNEKNSTQIEWVNSNLPENGDTVEFIRMSGDGTVRYFSEKDNFTLQDTSDPNVFLDFYYNVGSDSLHLFYEGRRLVEGRHYEEVGQDGESSKRIDLIYSNPDYTFNVGDDFSAVKAAIFPDHKHAHQHLPTGEDPLPIDPGDFQPTPNSPADLKIQIEGGTYTVSDNSRSIEVSPEVVGPFPAPNQDSRIDVVTLDDNGDFNINTGSVSQNPIAPQYPNNEMAIAEVRVSASTTEIDQVVDSLSSVSQGIRDVRPDYNLGGGTGGGGGGGQAGIIEEINGTLSAGDNEIPIPFEPIAEANLFVHLTGAYQSSPNFSLNQQGTKIILNETFDEDLEYTVKHVDPGQGNGVLQDEVTMIASPGQTYFNPGININPDGSDSMVFRSTGIQYQGANEDYTITNSGIIQFNNPIQEDERIHVAKFTAGHQGTAGSINEDYGTLNDGDDTINIDFPVPSKEFVFLNLGETWQSNDEFTMPDDETIVLNNPVDGDTDWFLKSVAPGIGPGGIVNKYHEDVSGGQTTVDPGFNFRTDARDLQVLKNGANQFIGGSRDFTVQGGQLVFNEPFDSSDDVDVIKYAGGSGSVKPHQTQHYEGGLQQLFAEQLASSGSQDELFRPDGSGGIELFGNDLTNLGGDTGSAGQILETDGSTPSWVTKDASDFSGADGTNGQVLTTDGTDTSWEDASEGNPTGTNSGDYNSEEVTETISHTGTINVQQVNGYVEGNVTLIDSDASSQASNQSVWFEGTTTNGNGNLNGVNIRNKNKNPYSITVRFSGVVE